MKNYVLGLDVGGTKCAAILGKGDTAESSPESLIIDKVGFPTEQPRGWKKVMEDFFNACGLLLERNGLQNADLRSIGVSCGGPLSSEEGVIYSPPNLPDWDGVPITAMLTERYSVPAFLQNDANACALAEWRFGAGRGFKNLIFLTFGTGMGAGLILEGKLYSGANDLAGEVGHVRLAETGPSGYGKNGAFEGFCSGGGIARLAKSMAEDWLAKGNKTSLCQSKNDMDSVTAKSVAEAAKSGDILAKEVYNLSGKYLGRGLSILIDILNPEAIVIGSIFERSGELLIPAMEQSLKEEALPLALENCRILPAKLGDKIGDYAALGVALNGIVD